jgi:Restriction endonuclease
MSEPLTRPKPSVLGQFGLSEERLREFDKANEKMTRMCSAWVFLLVWLTTSVVTGNILSGIFGVILMGIPLYLLIVQPAVSWNERRLCRQHGIEPARLAEAQQLQSDFNRRRQDYDEWFGRSQRAFWLSLSPNQFEHEVGRLYRRLGYSAQVTKQSRDGGVDVILRAEHGTTIVQCKAHQRKIGVKSFRELYGVMADFGAESAVLACLHGATDDARKFIQGKPIRVVMLNDLVQMSRELAEDISENAGADTARRG